MTSDKAGSVYIGGMVGGRMYGGTLPQYVSHGGNSDFFVTKYGYDCDCTTMAIPTTSFTTTITDSVNRKVKFTYTGTNPKDSVVWTLGERDYYEGRYLYPSIQ